jgi:DNA-binding SARP family transcriptional activator
VFCERHRRVRVSVFRESLARILYIYRPSGMAKLRLSFLGAPLVVVDGASIDLRPRKVLALLAYLADSSDRHSRDALADLLYPHQERDRARAGLRQCLSILRRSVGGEWIGVDNDYVWLAPGKGLWTDIDEVRSARDRAERQIGGNISAAVKLLDETEQLFRGEFLSGFFLRDSPGFESWHRAQTGKSRQGHRLRPTMAAP